ncbi:MAG: hypothetical protein MJZ64_05240 [Paludibacteraceae bacterium]|nr:hypothetical protein [Paludibacteraceae bacterium]
MDKETNLFDLCRSAYHAVVRFFVNIGRLIGRMLQLTYQHIWVVSVCVLLGLTGMLYYSRPGNRIYKVDGEVVLNGPSIEAVASYWEALNHHLPNVAEQNRGKILNLADTVALRMSRFETFYVIDSKHDGIADYVDYKRKVSPEDTLNVRMFNRLILRFRTKNVAALPEIEQRLMAYLNSRPSFVQAYATALPAIERQHRFDIDQIDKLDSLTSVFYFSPFGGGDVSTMQNTQLSFGDVNGKRSIELFTDEIEDFFVAGNIRAQSYAYREAPVVLVNHFVANARAVNGRLKCAILGLVIGWIIGCGIAGLVEKRKKVIAFLKR